MSKESILVRVGGAVALVTGVVGAGAAIESKSIHEAFADNNRQPICHSGNGENWTIIRPNDASYDAHIKDWKGKAKGHDNDYFAYDKDSDGDIDKDDCGSITSTKTAAYTPTEIPSSPTPENTPTQKITATSFPTETAVPTQEIVPSPSLEGPKPCITCEPCKKTVECDPCEELKRAANAQETSAAALAQKVGPEQTMAAADATEAVADTTKAAAEATDASANATLAFIESEKFEKENSENLNALITPTLKVVNADELGMENLSQLDQNSVAADYLKMGLAGTVILGAGAFLTKKEVDKRKKKS